MTAREVEVLRLVAQGLSNAEIAEQLIISLLTVKAHMRSLYNKLGISSRKRCHPLRHRASPPMSNAIVLFLRSFSLIQRLTNISSSSQRILASRSLELYTFLLPFYRSRCQHKYLPGSMFSRLQSRTLSIVKLHLDNTNDVSFPA